MPHIIVTGGKDIHISQRVFDQLVAAKQAGRESGHLMDLGDAGYIELGQIKQLYPDDATTNAETSNWEETKAKRAEYARQHDLLQSAYKLQSPQDKASRMIRTFCLLLWTARGNKEEQGQMIEGTTKDRLMVALTLWFRENEQAANAPRHVYEKIIPFGAKTGIQSKVKGVTSLGDALSHRTVA